MEKKFMEMCVKADQCQINFYDESWERTLAVWV